MAGSGEARSGFLAPSVGVSLVVDLRGSGGGLLSSLRILVVADMARRVIQEFRGLHPDVVALSGRTQRQDLISMVRFLGIPEHSLQFLAAGSVSDLEGIQIDLLVTGDDVALGCARSTIRVANTVLARFPGNAAREREVLDGFDPQVLKLALQRFHLAAPAGLSLARLHRAEETLGRWRFKVAGWHDMPPAEAPQDIVEAIQEALLGEPESADVLVMLHHIEVDHAMPSGGKFELFTRADRVLGLDLGHLIGKLRR